MTITIYKDNEANAIFIGDSNGVQFLNSLHASLDDPTAENLNISDQSKGVFVFHNMPYESFVDKDEEVYGETALEVCNALNAQFSASGTGDGTPPVITSATTVNLTQGDTLNYELTADKGVGFEWSGIPSGITTVEGNVRKLIGGSEISSGTYNMTATAINYFGKDTRTISLVISTPPYSNTKSVQFDNLDYLSADPADVQDVFERTGNGSGASDAWSVSFWMKPSSSSNNQQSVFYYGGDDLNNKGYIWARYLGSSSFRRLEFTYGTNYNHLKLQTPQNTFNVNQWHHVLITYDGGTTGSSSGSMSNYYSRFNIFVDGAQVTTSKTHSNYGYSGNIGSELFTLAKKGPATGYMRGGTKLDEFAVWASDRSSDISNIYNSGITHDLSLLTNSPDNWWRMGDEDIYPNLQDNVGSANFVMYNMTAADIVTDSP